MSDLTKKEKFKIFSKKIKICKLCDGLNIKNITENSPGYGNIDSRVMLIGQSLCGPCMKTQIPFTGGSGLILDRMFINIGIEKKDIFITNCVLCHPPNNRPSKPQELENCAPFLRIILKLIEPKLCILLGRDAIEWFLPESKNQALKSYVNNFFENREFNCKLYPVYHPAYVWRQLLSKDILNENSYNNNIENKTIVDNYIDPMIKIMEEYL